MKNPTRYFKPICALFNLLFTLQFASAQISISYKSNFPTGTPMNGVAYGNGKYVAVGYYSAIMVSTDGTNWNVGQMNAAITPTYNRIAFGNGLFVIIASDGQILTSPDAISWTPRTSGTTNALYDIIYANSTFIAIGNNNTALASANGITWTALNVGAASTDILQTIVYAQGKFVMGVRDAATSGSKSFYSTTGATNTWSNANIVSYVSLNKISFLNNKYFCFTSSTNIYTSSDAVTWTALINAALTTPNQMFHALYDGSKYYLFGNTSAYGYGSIYSSTDGNTFTLQPQTANITAQNAVYLNGMYFEVGNEGLAYSTDGINYYFPGGSHNAVATNGTRYVLAGQFSGNQASIYTSTDWNTWTNALTAFIKPLNGVTYGNGKFVAVGNTDASTYSVIATSSDGLNWSTGNTGIVDNLRAVAYGNGKYVAVGLSGRIIYSTNGTTWISAESVVGFNYYGISYVNNFFVAVGGSVTANTGMAKVKYSADGITWTDISPSIVGHFHAVAYGGGKYILVGRDNTTGVQKFFSVSTTNIASGSYSSAVTVSTPEGDVGTSGYGGVAYNNSTFVAVANLKASPYSAYVLTSEDGTSWTATAAGTTGRVRGIIADATSFKSAGTFDTRLNISAGLLLPLHLLSFTGRTNNSANILSWQTSDEINSDHFQVERSEDGSSFSPVAQVAAKNNSVNNDYSFTDVHVLANIEYYRLKMVDKDAKFVYSAVLKLTASIVKDNISIYPNPSTGYFTLTLPANLPYTMSIFNSNGDKMLDKAGSGNAQLIDVNQLRTGTFIISVQQGGKTYTEKLIRK